MDLTLINTVSSIQQSQTFNAVQTSVAGKVLDAARQEGQAAVALVQAAGQIGKSAAAANGIGGQFDAQG